MKKLIVILTLVVAAYGVTKITTTPNTDGTISVQVILAPTTGTTTPVVIGPTPTPTPTPTSVTPTVGGTVPDFGK